MSKGTNFFRNRQKEVLSTINTALPCKVLSYNESTRTAKLQPLYKEGNEKMSVLENVPALKQRYRVEGGSEIREYTQIFHPNDIVYVVFSKFPLDSALSGHITEQTDNMYRAHDAVIVGVF